MKLQSFFYSIDYGKNCNLFFFQKVNCFNFSDYKLKSIQCIRLIPLIMWGVDKIVNHEFLQVYFLYSD